MALSFRNMVAILATIVILPGVFLLMTVYRPINRQAGRVAKIRAFLEAQVEGAFPAGGQKAIGTGLKDAMPMDINFFKKRNLSPQKGIPDLLEQINRMGNQMDIQFVAVKPLEEEDTSEYRLYPFLIETKAAYPALVSFVHRMENGLRLSLNGLRIETDKKDPAMHRLQFTLSIFELKDDGVVGTGESSEKVILPAMNRDLIALDRDPFSPKKEVQVVPVVEKPKKINVARRKRNRPKLVLKGILEVGGRRVAIINDKPLRLGEVIHRQRLEQIEDDHVIIAEGAKRYPLYLEDSTPLKKREGK